MRISSPVHAVRASALAAAILCAPAAHAATLSFDFTFNNVLNGGGTVTGIIDGLSEGTGPATSVRVLTNTAGFGIGEFVGNPIPNSWTVAGGAITAFAFLSGGALNTSPAVMDASLFFNSTSFAGTPFRASLSNSGAGIVIGDENVSQADIGLTFTPRSATTVIPLPAAGWLLLGGLGALAGLGAARGRPAAA